MDSRISFRTELRVDHNDSCSLPFVRNFRRALIAVVCLLFAVGCEPRAADSASNSEGAQPSVPAEVTQAISGMEKVGVAFKLNDAGMPTEADLRKATLNDELIGQLSKLTSVQSINAMDSPFFDDHLAQLSSLAPQLTSLDLRGCAISDKSAAVIATMAKLRALRLSGKNGKTSFGDDGLRQIAACKSLKVLAADDLWLGGTDSDKGSTLNALVEMPDLEELYLARTTVDDAAMDVIAKLPKLRKLRLAGTTIGDTGLASLSRLNGLIELDLSENAVISNSGMSHVAKLTSLQKLNLWRVQITDEGVLQLATLKNLTWFNLDNSQLSDDGIAVLREMKQLTFLHLGSTRITAASVPGLVHLSALKDLKITRTALGSDNEAVAKLKAALPGTEIQTEYVEGQ